MAATGWVSSHVFQTVYIWVCLQGKSYTAVIVIPDDLTNYTVLLEVGFF